MTSAAILKPKKASAAAAESKRRPVKGTAAPRPFKPGAMDQRREFATLMRSIKTLVHQSP